MWKNWNPFRRKEKDSNEGIVNKDPNLSLNQNPVSDSSGKENSFSSHSRLSNDGSGSEQEYNDSSNQNGNGVNSSHVYRPKSLRSRTSMGIKDHLNTSLPASRSGVGRPITRAVNDYSHERLANKTFSGVHGPLLSSPIVPQIRKALESQSSIGSHGIISKHGKPVGRSASLNYGMSRNLTRSTAGQVPWVKLKRRESIGLSDLVTGNTPQSPNTVKLAAPEPRHLPAPPSFKSTLVIVTTEPSRNRLIDTQTVVSALREKRKRFTSSQQDEVAAEESWHNSKRRRQDSSQSNASSVSIPPMPDTLPDLMGSPGASLLHIEKLASQRPSTVPAAVDPYPTAPAMANKTGGAPHMPGFSGFHGSQVMGLGGVDVTAANPVALPSQQLPFYRYPLYPQQQPQHSQQPSLQQRKAQYMAGGAGGGNINNSKSVLRSIQSSLSSSMKTRVNSAALQQHGIDLKRIRGNTQGNTRRLSFSSAVSSDTRSSDEPVSKSSKQSTSPNTSTVNQQQSTVKTNTDQVAVQPGVTRKESAVSTPTKRKIAEGVMLRKQNLSISGTASPVRPLRALPASTLISADDFENDRQQEYKCRVLDMLGAEEKDNDATNKEFTTATSNATATGTSATSAHPLATVAPATAALSSVSSHVATDTINSSLASLSKLVQSTNPEAPTTAASTTPATSTSTAPTSTALSQLLQAEDDADENPHGKVTGVSLKGNPLTSPVSNQSQSVASASTTSAAVTVSASAPQATSVATVTQPAQPSPSAGFQVNFASAMSKASTATIPPGFSFGVTSTAPNATTSLLSTTSFPASLGTASSLAENTSKASSNLAATGPAVQLATSAAPSNTAVGDNSAVSTLTLPDQQKPVASDNAVSKGFNFSVGSGTAGFAFGSAPSATSTSAALMPSQGFNFATTSTKTTSVPASVVGGINFGAPGIQTSLPMPAATSAPQVAAPNFSFGSTTIAPVNSTNTTAVPSSSGVQPNAPPYTSAVQQTLGGSGLFSSLAPTTKTVASFGGFGTSLAPQTSLTSSSSNTAPGFGALNNPLLATSSTPAQAPAPTSGLLATSAPTSGLVTTSAPTPAPAFGSTTFGGGNSLSQTSGSSATGFLGAVTSFNFSGVSNTAGQTESKPFTFGASTTTTGSSISFGATPAASSGFGANASSLTGFGATSTSTVTSPFGAAKSGFGFGASSLTSATTPAFGTAPLSVFGTSVPSTTGSGFGGGNLTFGNAQSTSASTGFGSVASPGFGATSAFNQTAPAFGVTTASNFGAAPKPFGATTEAPSIVSSTTSPSTAFGVSPGMAPAFGSTTLQTTQVSTPFVFGGSAPSSSSNKPFNFGGSTSTSTQPPLFGSSAGAAASSFGQATTTTSNSIFGNSGSINKPAFGVPAPTPAFGAPSNSLSTGSGFGSGLASPPAFGTDSQQPKQSAPTFGATGFGNNILQNTAFGAQSSNQTHSLSGVASPFGGANLFGNSAKPSMFGAGASTTRPAAPVFNFSGTQQQQQPQMSSAFGAQPPAAGPVPSTFNFGAASPTGGLQPQTGGFNFAAAAQTPAKPTATPAGFNFAAAASSNPTFNFGAGSAPTANMFTPQPGSTPRPRAAATRRAGSKQRSRR
ncbi:WD40-like domain-containing protein [Plakobranchus ocellatus]|uniref:WD40-like domain-containing protein n=1 Tax=Plakobranchus ocellatus TaxID=259542 RepID=A0AAV3Z980_9GAST|nr:WD40-like domain-containing protein [Plakobranchus ocellatus]